MEVCSKFQNLYSQIISPISLGLENNANGKRKLERLPNGTKSASHSYSEIDSLTKSQINDEPYFVFPTALSFGNLFS